MSTPISPAPTLSAQDILALVKANFHGGQKRKFLPGLLIAFINFLQELGATGAKYRDLDELFVDFPQVTSAKSGGGINTLSVKTEKGNRSIRKHYDAIASWFRSDMQRFDYPSSAPHATQAWRDYIPWIEALLSFDAATLEHLEASTMDFVLDALPSQRVDPKEVVRDPPVFLLFLQQFDMSKQMGETTGAAFQGTVFGYIRADAPHLQVEVGKVRTGSKREKRVGDVDARDGNRLVLSAEVKQFVVVEETLPDLAEFARLIALNKALGMVVALGFETPASEALSKMGLEPISRQDLIERVRLWDPLKQRIAMNAVLYYADFREQNSALYERIKTFVSEIAATTS